MKVSRFLTRLLFCSKPARVRLLLGYGTATVIMLSVTCQAVTVPFVGTGSMAISRSSHTATLLANGKVLLAGGGSSSAELYDPSKGTWTSTGSMAISRSSHTATLLANGKVLVAGGYNLLSSAELYDPSTGAWTSTGSMTIGRYSHTATLLANGKVLVAGCDVGGGDRSSAELYDPSTGTWTSTGSMTIGRYYHTAALLANGKVLVAGGGSSSSELYDPSTGTWTSTGSMAKSRSSHTATLLDNGKVLVTGGDLVGVHSSAELYEPSTGAWTSTGSMAIGRELHTATLLDNGKVLVTGGYNGGTPSLSSAELYDPSTGTWTNTVSMANSRRYHTATLVTNGKVLVAGGYTAGIRFSSAELWGCMILFNPVGGSVETTSKCYYSVVDKYGAMPIPGYPNFEFAGWWTDRLGDGTQVTSETTLVTSADHTLYARWMPNDLSCVNGIGFEPIGKTSSVKASKENAGDGGVSFKLGGVGLITDGEMTGIEWTTTGPGFLSFDWKVSSEEGYDFLGFYEVGAGGTNQISGTGDGWARRTLEVGGDSNIVHTFRWEYEKDPISEYVADDCGWVDAVTWTPKFILSVNGGEGDGWYTNGTDVAIVADAPEQHYTFDHWAGDTNGIADIFASVTTIAMPYTNATVTATYKMILSGMLTVVNGIGSGEYTYGSLVEIEASNFGGKQFYRWTGDVDTVTSISSALTTVAILDPAISVAAIYSVPLTVVNGLGSGLYPEGSTVTVTADPDPLYMEFAGWTGDGAGFLDDTSATTASLTMPTDATDLTATYQASIARVSGSYGHTYTADGAVGGISTDTGAGSPSGNASVKLGGTGMVLDNGFTAFETIVSGSGSVTFWWKTTSEVNDCLKFKVDGGQRGAISGTKTLWTFVSNRVEGAGINHTLRWEYAKNGSASSSTDAGWVDDIVWFGDVPMPAITPNIRETVADGEEFKFSFWGERGIPYTVYSNATLSTSGWVPMDIEPQEVEEINGVFRYEATIIPPAGQSSGFYRVKGGGQP